MRFILLYLMMMLPSDAFIINQLFKYIHYHIVTMRYMLLALMMRFPSDAFAYALVMRLPPDACARALVYLVLHYH